ncbi:alpha/beta fold hydrolase [Streptomyces sp. NBC_00631]|uniref:alpha/beta fold hydrolase n=1 Tax=Streptomyces sp. NBC_00631 TaxID=2975793 RepID=UPI00386B913A
MADLPDRYRVIAPDLRGIGASSRAASGYDAGTLAEDAAALLTTLGVSSAAVGASTRVPHRRSFSRCVAPVGSGAWSSWSPFWAGCLSPRTSSPTGRPGGSASIPPRPALPRRCWRATRLPTSTGFCAPARSATGCALPSGTPSSAHTPAARR